MPRTEIVIGPKSCPINERTGDGRLVGRCWFHTGDNGICPRHGDVSLALKRFHKTGKLTDEIVHKQAQKRSKK